MKIFIHMLVCTLLLSGLTALTYGQSKPQIQSEKEGNTVTFKIKHLKEPKLHPSYDRLDKDDCRWKVLWEFGDGSFAQGNLQKSWTHTYKTPDIYHVKLYLIPCYSEELDLTAEEYVEIKRPQNTGRDSLEKPLVFVSNSGGIVAEKYHIRHAIQCQFPQNVQSGYLAIFYNREEEVEFLDRKPFQYLDEETKPKLYQPGMYGANFTRLHESDIRVLPYLKVDSLRDVYEDILLFKVSNITNPDRIASYFMSFLVTEHEEGKHAHKEVNLKDSSVDLEIITVFCSDNQTLSAEKIHYPCKLQLAIDPNGIEGWPKHQTYLGPGTPARFKVSFENEGKEKVGDIHIILPWNDQLDPNIEIEEVKVNYPKRSYDCSNEKCTKDEDNGYHSFCYKIVESSPDQVVVEFHNIDLPGKFHPLTEKKDSRGHMIFTAKSLTQNNIKTQNAIIKFICSGCGELETAKKGKVKWVQRQWVPDGGYLSHPNILDSAQTGNYTIGLSYQQTKMNGRGGYRLRLAYGNFRHIYTDSVEMIDRRPVYLTDSLRLQSLELSYQRFFSLTKWASIVAGGGIIVPISGYYLSRIERGDRQIDQQAYEFSPLRSTLVKKDPDNPELFYSFYGSVGIELGRKNTGTLGIYYEPIFYETILNPHPQPLHSNYDPLTQSAVFVPYQRISVRLSFPLNNRQMPARF